jgi:PTS system nitrogen regulatory IIA component
MTDDILTIEEVAKYLRISERTVYDWAQKGEIPAGKFGTVWRFKKEEIERWVDGRLSFNNTSPRFSPLQAGAVLSPQRILFLNSAGKREALLSLAEVLGTAPEIKNRDELREAILTREDIMSTAIGKGIAIPHVRLQSVSDLVVAVGICRLPINDFFPLDDEPVRIVIMIAAAYTQHVYYLQTLSFFSSRLKNSELRDAVAAAKDENEAYQLLTASCGIPTASC